MLLIVLLAMSKLKAVLVGPRKFVGLVLAEPRWRTDPRDGEVKETDVDDCSRLESLCRPAIVL
jgi:hypothetical protein